MSGPVVERFDVVEEDCAEFAPGDLSPVAMGVSYLAFERGQVDSIAALSQHTPVAPNDGVTFQSLSRFENSTDVY